MMDAFDAAFDTPQQPQPKRQYDVAPEGHAEVEIVAARVGNVPWKACDENPSGTCLQLRLSPGSAYSFVFADVPANLKWLHGIVARAVNIEAADLVPDQLIGLRATVEIKHFTKRDGTIKASVGKWLPHPDARKPARGDKQRRPADQSPADGSRQRPPQDQQRAPAAAPHRPRATRNARPQIDSDDFPF
jgi:hypothetical protein